MSGKSGKPLRETSLYRIHQCVRLVYEHQEGFFGIVVVLEAVPTLLTLLEIDIRSMRVRGENVKICKNHFIKTASRNITRRITCLKGKMATGKIKIFEKVITIFERVIK